VLGCQRERARRILGVAGGCGAVTVVQRFGGALNMNVHLHVLVLDLRRRGRPDALIDGKRIQ
jgi:hypothetical protein